MGELSAKDLREFVSDLMQSDLQEEQKRKEFALRREEEMLRRERFEASHPNFKMPDIGVASAVVRAVDSDVYPANESPLESSSEYAQYSDLGQGQEYKQQLLAKFRQGQPAHLTSGGYISRQDGLGLADTEVLKQVYEDYDYETVAAAAAEKGHTKTSKESVIDAILSDALQDYKFVPAKLGN
eukprot:NODE_4818_length_625_cov_56.954861_g4145_i0.p1 GENE.NODE_4818_length_625_cov_56.954861_g4145_i0~~NODE_4818_length_625_cov_56.954861_g4145_i0.p1  ORF type:complete len:183 (-),score=62.52 NODE_4818_length_625_cov_56.954861_g4145_i0:45-593(-)